MLITQFPLLCFKTKAKKRHEFTFGNQGGMSNVCNFGWHEWVCFRDYGSFYENKEKLGSVFGSYKNIGDEMSQSIVTSSSYVMMRRTA